MRLHYDPEIKNVTADATTSTVTFLYSLFQKHRLFLFQCGDEIKFHHEA